MAFVPSGARPVGGIDPGKGAAINIFDSASGQQRDGAVMPITLLTLGNHGIGVQRLDRRARRLARADDGPDHVETDTVDRTCRRVGGQ